MTMLKFHGPPDRAKVHVIDNDLEFCGGIVRMLGAAGFPATNHASTKEFLLTKTDDSPRCVLLDILMPGSNAIDLLAALAPGKLRAPVIFMTGDEDVAASVRAMKAGAMDFLVKPLDPEKLLASVRRAIAIDTERCAAVSRIRLVRMRYDRLTDRERWVMAGVVQGKLNKQLAVEMYMSERTVKAHRAKIMAKLEIESMTDLVRISLLLGLPAIRRPIRREVQTMSTDSTISV